MYRHKPAIRAYPCMHLFVRRAARSLLQVTVHFGAAISVDPVPVIATR